VNKTSELNKNISDKVFKLKINTKEIKVFDFPLIDYSLHPAFNFSEKNKKLSKQINKNISCCDKEISFIIKSLKQKKKLSKKIFKNEFKKFNYHIDELIKIIDDLKRINVNYDCFQIYDRVKSSIIKTKYKIQDEILFLINEEKKNIYNLDINNDIKKIGFLLYKLDPNTIEKINKLLFNEISHLKNNSVIEPGPRKVVGFNYTRNILKFNKLKKIIKKTILFSDFKKLNPKIDIESISVEYSYPGSNWYKNCYSDLNIKTSEGAYFHVDYEYDLYKSIIYLNNVNKENGPFSYIPGSNNMPRNQFLFRYFKELDIELNDHFTKQINEKKIDLGPKKYYHRKWFALDDFRRQLSIIPKQLLGASHFGDDLMISNKSHDFLLKHEFKITSDIANAFTFNGHDGIHRGGLTKKGERIVVFIAWGNKINLIVRYLEIIKNVLSNKIKKLKKYEIFN